MQPTEAERICLISYEITHTLLGGGPDSRPSFWKVYRTELALNLKTGYENYHTHVCRPVLAPIIPKLKDPYFFRRGKLVMEKPAAVPVRPLAQ